MLSSVRTLLANIVDYAGLFPPAKLDLDTAIRNYARYAHGPDAWMLGRFVCPASRLAAVAPYVDELFDTDAVLRLSVLGRSGKTSGEFLQAFHGDLDDIAGLSGRADERTAVEGFEVRLPGDLHTTEQVVNLLKSAADLWTESGAGRLPVFYEPADAGEWRTSWPSIIRGLAESGSAARRGGDPHGAGNGFKLRCGGVNASAFPSVEQVVSVICGTHAAGVPLKFTAGLHHPLHHYNAQLQAEEHGFLNVFLGGALAAADEIDEVQLREVLTSEDIGAFGFTGEGITWNKTRVSCDDLTAARRQAVTSFGSCSFDEPVQDLRSLGLL